MNRSGLRRFIHRLTGADRVLSRLDQRADELRRLLELGERDSSSELGSIEVALMDCMDRLADLESLAVGRLEADLQIETNSPVALYSDDHKYPRGVRNDNTRHPRFVRAVESYFGRKVRHVDLGCAGGGLVLDFLLRGHDSAGVEGSDFALKEQRAEWRVIPGHLFTADITKPFVFRSKSSGTQATFDVITAWEVLEHIPEALLPGLLGNLKTNLAPAGIFVASVATFEDTDPETGAIYHVTVKPKTWWFETFRKYGLEPSESPFNVRDYVRGSGNPRVGPRGSWDWNAASDPKMGFHVALRIAK